MKKTIATQKSGLSRAFCLGIFIGIMITISSAGIHAILLLNGAVEERITAYVSAAIQLISVLLGAILANKIRGEKYILTSGLVAGAYYLLLIAMTLLLFDGKITGIALGTGMCLIGWVAANIISHFTNQKSHFKKRRL